jgi:NACHT domain
MFLDSAVANVRLSSYTVTDDCERIASASMSRRRRSTLSSRHNGEISLWTQLCRWLWKYPLRFLLFTLIVNVAINIISTWLITPAQTNAIPATSIIGAIPGWVSTHWLLSSFLGTGSVLLLVVTWQGSRQPRSEPSVPVQIRMSAPDRERMLGRLRFTYKQLLSQSLQEPVPIELRLSSRPSAVHNAANHSSRPPKQPEQALPEHTSIIDAYKQAEGELLILGKPGAGKSTLLNELALYLVSLAEQDSTQPLPVQLDLASWAEKQLRLQDWLSEELFLRYQVPQSLSTQWIQAGMILPLLDGLDEMNELLRPACIAAINTYHGKHLRPLVVCSRTQEYDKAARRERLNLLTAVEVQPLTRDQVNTYLGILGKPQATLRAALKKNEAVQKLATTPLMLQVLMRAYRGTPMRVLSQDATNLQKQVWMDYVQRMIQERGDAKRYPLDVIRARLAWLARQMRERNQKVFYLEQLQPDWLPHNLKGWYELSVWVAIRLLVGLLFGLPAGWLFGPLVGIPTGLATGNIVGLFYRTTAKIEPAEALAWSWKDVWSGVALLLKLALVLALALELIALLGQGIVRIVGPAILLVLALTLLLRTALFSGFSGKQLPKRENLFPNEGIRQSIKNGLLLLAIDLGLGLLCGLVLLALGLSYGLLVGVSLAVFSGLFYSRSHGLGAALQHYTLRFWLWRTHRFPLRSVPFLEDATARILLQRDGGGYRFSHELLLTYFANLDTTTPRWLIPNQRSHSP